MIKNVPVGNFPQAFHQFIILDSFMTTETVSMDDSLFGHDTENITMLVQLCSLTHFLRNDSFAFTDKFICQDSIYSYCR